jgi:hypothetical protein
MAETIGWLTDKIIISELKIHHMVKQVERVDVNDDHKIMCLKRLSVLQEQRNDLKAELVELFDNVMAGKARLKVYRQYKMYNDPRFRMPSKSS